MDIVEFIEEILGIKLLDFQKETIKVFANLPEGFHVVMGRNGPYILDKDGKRITKGVVNDGSKEINS